MPPDLPYALTPLQFPFPALVALAGRLPLGGGREVALAALVVARLAHDALGAPGAPSLGAAEREVRAAAARVWLASLALPAPVRTACARCVDATAGPPAGLSAPVRSLLHVVAAQLDPAGVRELERLLRLPEEA